MKKKDIILWISALVSLPIIYKLVMWLIEDYGISPMFASLIIIYVALVTPQHSALHALKLMNAVNEGEELNTVKADKKNWILFVNDFSLSSYFGSDTMPKLITSLLLKVSIPVMLFSLLYINLLVVFIDLGPSFTVFIMYAMLVSIAVYLVTKTIMVMYFLNMFKGIGLALVGIAHPFGFMLITASVKHYFNSLEEVRREEMMGMTYD